MTDENLFEEEAKTLLRQIYGLPGLPPSSMEHSFHTIKNALYSAFCDGVASDQSDRQGWRTVDSAPKDETHILGYNGEDMFVMDWLGTEWQLTHSGTYADDGDIWPDPTHWMPLPSPPKSTDDSKEAEANG